MELLQDMQEYIEKLIKAIEMTGDKFGESKPVEAYGILGHMAEGLVWLTQGVTAYKDNVEELDIETARLNELLGEMVDAMESQDEILIMDLLEYELKEVLEEWNDVLVQKTAH
ncbi:MAG: hypothetical protein ATN35_01960 [Epulopiscium sp. Nele67-Bin004]|nr:MAG: hypothetical protein ATN35_01960 [Epulopiscium sp. Nele67-Bin004]